MIVSPQTRDTYIEQTSKVRQHALSVLMEEEESHYFEESELESQFSGDNGDDTLNQGKKTSKQRKSKRKEKQEKRVAKKQAKIGKAGVCGTGQDKACCTIF